MLSISKISNKPIHILKNSTISDVIKKLLDFKLSRLIVVEDGKPIGIITEKDIGLFLFSETSQRGLDDIPISKIMKPILFVEEELTPQESAKLMIEKYLNDSISVPWWEEYILNAEINYNAETSKRME